ncbi:glycosyltransferase family 4 protein [bacterium]|nr:glycosyltransferase family 4 protein [bacterium]
MSANNSPKILFLTSRVPYPPIGGDRLKNYNLLKILSSSFQVHLVALTDAKLERNAEEFIRAHTAQFKVFSISKFRFYFNAAKSIYNGFPLQVNYYYFRHVWEYVNKASKDVDLVYSTLIRTARYAESISVPKILEMADSVGLNYLRSIEKTRSLFWKLIYRFEVQRLLSFERRSIDLFDKTIFFNQGERKFFNNDSKTAWVPHGVNEELLEYDQVDSRFGNSIGFFGKMDTQHNIDAVFWFCDHVIQHIEPTLRLIIVGADPKKAVLGLPKKYPNVEVTQYVEDPYRILRSCVCVVAPLQTGAGIQNKILESMAVGAIVVTTSLSSIALEGVRNNRELVIEDNPIEMALKINDIHRNPRSYQKMKISARNYIRNHFTWEDYRTNLFYLIDEMLYGSRCENSSVEAER